MSTSLDADLDKSVDTRLVVILDSDLDVFSSVEAAEGYLEPFEIEEDLVSLVVDGAGNGYRAEIVHEQSGWGIFKCKIPCVKLRPADSDREANIAALASEIVRRQRLVSPEDKLLHHADDPRYVVREFLRHCSLTT
jgi:hypothetical protein